MLLLLWFLVILFFFFFFKQKTAYEMRISDWSSDVCSSDLPALVALGGVVRVDQQLDEIGIDRFVLAPRFAFARGGRGSVGGGNALPRLAERRGVDEAGAGLFERLGEIGRAACRARVCQYV